MTGPTRSEVLARTTIPTWYYKELVEDSRKLDKINEEKEEVCSLRKQ